MNALLRNAPFLFLLAASQAGAQEVLPGSGTAQRLDEFLSLSLAELMAMEVTISTQTRQKLSKAPAVVSVITAEDIKAMGAANLVEVLESVPGMYIRANLFGFRPLVGMRGAPGTHTLIMVDGAPLKDLVWNSGIFWKGLPTSMIERIEIIRGPGSALYGSDASAGVINVITRASRPVPPGEAGVRLGSDATREAWVQQGGDWRGYQVGVSANVSRTDGHEPYIARHAQTAAGDPPGVAGYGWNNLDLRLGVARGDWRLQADYTRHGDVEAGLTGAAVLDPVTEGTDHRFNLALLYNAPQFAPHWALNAEWRFQHLGYDSGDGFQERPPGYTDGAAVYPDGQINRMRSAERRLSFEVSGQYGGLADHAIRLGTGFVLQDLYKVEQYVNYGLGPTGAAIPAGSGLVDLSDSPYAFAPEQARRTAYAFVQDVWTLSEDWELTTGVRYDHYSDFGSAWTPRLALVWQTTERLTTKLLYGEAFRAPSYLELYAPTSFSRSNPELAPEASRTTELSLTYVPRTNWRLGLNLYQFDQSDLIAVVAGQYQNRSDLRTRGVETEVQWQASPALGFAANYAQHRYDDPAVPAFRVPDRQAYLRMDWNFRPGWHWNLQANWISAHELAAGDARAPIDAYTLVDTTLRHRLGKDWEVAATVRNLFDVDARELSSPRIPDNLPLPGRSVFVQVRHGF